jgi:ADP-heptose:LPS heptosyltransferase
MKIAIKLPDELDKRVLTFPFLHSLKKILDKRFEEEDQDEMLELHFIGLKDHIDVLNLLPFNAYYHEMEKEDLQTVFSVHRAIVTSKLEEMDVFISMTDGFVDASMGKNLKAKETIGFGIGKNKFLFKIKIPYLKGQHLSDIYYQLLKGITQDDLPVIPNVFSRELSAHYADWNMNPYIMVNIDAKNEVLNPEWKDFFELFEGKNIVVMSDAINPLQQKEFLQEYLKDLPEKNNYKIFEYESNIGFGKVVAYAQTFITFDSPLVHVAAYIGSHTFWLNNKPNVNMTPQYCIGEVRQFNLTEPQYKEGSDVNYAPIFDEIYEYVDKKTVTEDNGTE